MHKKWIVIILCVALLFALDFLYPKKNLFSRAIVVGIGVGMDSNELVLTIEYESKDKNEVHQSQGKDFKSVLDKMQTEIGLKVSIAQCVVLVVDATIDDISTVMNDLAEHNYVGNNITMVCCDGANEVFSKEIVGDDSVSQLIVNVMSVESHKFVLRDYFVKKCGKEQILIPQINLANKTIKIVGEKAYL